MEAILFSGRWVNYLILKHIWVIIYEITQESLQMNVLEPRRLSTLIEVMALDPQYCEET